MFEVRIARSSELDAIIGFYAQMISEMRGTEFDILWDSDVHPSAEFLRESVEAGQVYVGVLDDGDSGNEGASDVNNARIDDGERGVSEGDVGSGDASSEKGRVCGEDGIGGVADVSTGRADGRIVCAMVMNEEGEPDYDKVSWRVRAARDEVLIVHVLGTLPEFHGRGFARQLLSVGIEAARAAGKKAVRLDTFAYNTRAQHLYESQGFARIGIFPDFYPDLDSIDAVVYEYEL